jgi:hypothetical protein
MSYEEDLYSALIADPTLSAIVGTRVAADFVDSSEAKPYLVYQTITTSGETPHDGERANDFPLIQISAWAETKAETLAIESALVNLLDGNTMPGVSDLSLVFDDSQSRYESDSNLFGKILDFRGSCNRN